MKKSNKKYAMLLLAGLSMVFSIVSCQLDYENTNTINPDNAWNDPAMIKSYVSNIHGGMMPGWPVNGASSDEASNGFGNMSDYMRGIIDVVNSAASEFNYDNIDRINFFLEKIKTVPETVMSGTDKDKLVGQMLFWRAWAYWGMVSQEGGVPLITKVQDVKDNASLFVPRNKTSECMAQIFADLDEAIAKLPLTWSGADYGRIDKCAAAAFKGKVLMWYASPLFNPSNDAARWQTAYNATKSAVDICTSAGKGLVSKFDDIWKIERNKEVIMVNQFYYPDHAFNNSGIRPEFITGGNSNQNLPYLSLITGFPKKDGNMLMFDSNQIGNDMYEQQFLTDMYTNMDDRFYSTVFCPGIVFPSKDSKDGRLKGMSMWSTWKNVGAPDYNTSMIPLQTGGLGLGTTTLGFFPIKGLDQTLDQSTKDNGQMDWIEIRFAEVLMNYGECANETGKTNEAIDVLRQIRTRAGVTAANGGITAGTQTEIREAYITERFSEFALEGKRFNDLRRLKRYDILDSHVNRKGIKIVIKDNSTVGGDSGNGSVTFDWSSNMKDAATRQQFKIVYIPSIDGDPSVWKFNLNKSHWFYPVNKKDLDRNSKLLQNAEWGGTFDPLQ